MNEIILQYAKADRDKREAEDKLKGAKAILEELEPQVLEIMSTLGVDKLTVQGVTYSPRRSLFVGPDAEAGADRAAITEALKAAGLTQYVSEGYNANSLAGYVRALADEHGGRDLLSIQQLHELLPKPLRPVLRVAEQWSVGSRKA